MQDSEAGVGVGTGVGGRVGVGVGGGADNALSMFNCSSRLLHKCPTHRYDPIVIEYYPHRLTEQ